MKKTRTTAAEKLVILRNIIVQGKCAWNLKELERDGSKAGIVTQAIKDVLQSLCDDNLVDQDKIGSGSFFWSFSSKQQVRLEGKIKALEAEKEELLAKQAELQARTKEASATRSGEVRWGGCEPCRLWVACAGCVSQAGMKRVTLDLTSREYATPSCVTVPLRLPGQDRAVKMAQYQKLLQERAQLQQQVAAFQENSPEKISRNEEAIRNVKVGVSPPQSWWHYRGSGCTSSWPSITLGLNSSAQLFCFGNALRTFAAAVFLGATEQAGVNRWTDNIWCTQSYCKKNFNITGKDFWQNLDGVNDEIDNV
jgi:hypothetical protein